MQLKQPATPARRPLAARIAAATTGLLAATAVPLATAADEFAGDDIGWEFNTAALYYGEQDSRVQDASAALDATRTFEDGRQLVLGLAFDTLTGATPTGAVPLHQPQTFTRPSARGQYITPAGSTPTDDSFKDTRTAAHASWTQPFGEHWSGTAGLSFSTEYDYLHLGANASVAREFDNGNRTVSLGVAYAQDEWDPEGGVPVPLTEMLGRRSGGGGDDDDDDGGAAGQPNKVPGTRDKTVVDFLVGVSQVIDERTIVQASYSFSRSEDYLNDPFKFLTVLDPAGLPVAGPDGLFSYRFENRPDERSKHSVFLKVKRYVAGGALAASYRFMTDDWGIDSHTLDTRYRWNVARRWYLEPHVRVYQQSQADFFAANLTTSDPTPLFASADYRLGKFTGLTAGAKVGFRLANGNELALRGEWYAQRGTANLQGVAEPDDVFPDLNAVIVQLSYRFRPGGWRGWRPWRRDR